MKLVREKMSLSAFFEPFFPSLKYRRKLNHCWNWKWFKFGLTFFVWCQLRCKNSFRRSWGIWKHLNLNWHLTAAIGGIFPMSVSFNRVCWGIWDSTDCAWGWRIAHGWSDVKHTSPWSSLLLHFVTSKDVWRLQTTASSIFVFHKISVNTYSYRVNEMWRKLP